MKSVLVVSSLLSLVAAVCDYGTSSNPRIGKRAGEAFDYAGLMGPLDWHGLSAENAGCAVGKAQSPIDVVPADNVVVIGADLSLEVPPYVDGAEFRNLGTTLQVFVNGSVIVNNKTYNLAQFHFHTPSEHRILSEYYPMETHFVFEAADKTKTVVGFVVEVAGPADIPSSVLSSVFANVDSITEAGSVGTTGSLDFTPIIDHIGSSHVYQYGGSLTTPPCSEGVAWNVVKEPIFIDVSTYRKVKSILKFNSRYTQNKVGDINLLDNAREVLDTAL